MKLRVEVDRVVACVSLKGAWTPELVETLLRQCGDEVMRICLAIGVEPSEAGEDTEA